MALSPGTGDQPGSRAFLLLVLIQGFILASESGRFFLVKITSKTFPGLTMVANNVMAAGCVGTVHHKRGWPWVPKEEESQQEIGCSPPG